MSWTRRSWLGAVLYGALAALLSASGLSAKAQAAGRTPRRRPRVRPGEPYKTRWIGHY